MPLFCRHNRLEADCPICQREKAPPKPARGTASRTPGARRPGRAPAARRHGSGSRAGHLVTRRLAREADDGYRNALVPGVKATSGAERLATALTAAAARLEFPGPHPELADAGDPLRLALTLVGADDRAREAFERWTPPAGDAAWSPQKRFARWFDRLALPGFPRAQRFEFLVALGAAGVLELEADALHVAVKDDDATTLGAKRALNSGDAILLERRAAALAEAAAVPIGALDRGLAWWEGGGAPDTEAAPAVRAALGL